MTDDGRASTLSGPSLPQVASRVCVDCPAHTASALLSLVGGGKGECAFRCIAVEERDIVPSRWFDEHAIAFVRRGIVVRQRVDAHGRAYAIDAVGPGSLFTLRARTDSPTSSTGYAATRALACVCPRDVFADALGREDVARDYVALQAMAIERVERLAEARSRVDAPSAIASLLVCLVDTLCPHPIDRIPAGLQQRDLAALVGVRHETVCRALKRFAREGLVEKNPDGLRVVDRDALLAL